MSYLEWMLVAVGFTGAWTLVVFTRALKRHFGRVASFTQHFSPKGGCTEAIVAELNRARREILVQAYSFTCPMIATALIAARKRGVTVHILLDRANEKETYSELGALEKQGLDVLIDAHHAIAHNKIMVVDRRVLLTGSFNFTRQAENENAENLLVIKGNRTLVQAYVDNFMAHRAHAQAPGTVMSEPLVGGENRRAA